MPVMWYLLPAASSVPATTVPGLSPPPATTGLSTSRDPARNDEGARMRSPEHTEHAQQRPRGCLNRQARSMAIVPARVATCFFAP